MGNTNCKGKIGNTCGKKHPAKCIDYEGTYHNNTELEVCDCNSLEDVIEDINSELNDINDSIDLTNLGESCIEYTQEGDTLKVSEALLAIESKVCELVEHTGLGAPEPCPGCNEDPCGESGGCCTGLVHYGYGVGEFFVDDNIYDVWKTVTVGGYTDLEYTILQSGTYKVTLDIGCAEEDINGRCYIGISLNNIDPITSPFTQYEVIPLSNSHTFHFILPNVNNNTPLKVKFKGNAIGSVAFDGIKIIIEKIG